MEGFESRNKVTFLAYEFFGSALTTMAFNMNGGFG
jgi:hypothetical protein